MKALPIAFLLQGVPFLFLSTIIMRVRNSVQCLFYFFYRFHKSYSVDYQCIIDAESVSA